jgi:RNase P protein component
MRLLVRSQRLSPCAGRVLIFAQGEELVFTAIAEEGEHPRALLVSRDTKIKRGDKEYNYFEIGYHWGRKEFGADLQYDTPEVLKPGTRFARPIMSSYGGYECFAKDIPSVIACLEQKFNIRIRVEGATMEQINRAGRLIHEEAVTPKLYEIGLTEVMSSNSEQVLKELLDTDIVIARRAGVGDAPTQAVGEKAMQLVLENYKALARHIEMEIDNVDWTTRLTHGSDVSNAKVPEAVGRSYVKRELRELLERARESFDYECEKDWGVLSREERRTDLSKGEQYAEAFWQELVAGPRREELNALAVEMERKEEASLCKKAVRAFLDAYVQGMKRRVEQLR